MSEYVNGMPDREGWWWGYLEEMGWRPIHVKMEDGRLVAIRPQVINPADAWEPMNAAPWPKRIVWSDRIPSPSEIPDDRGSPLLAAAEFALRVFGPETLLYRDDPVLARVAVGLGDAVARAKGGRG